MTYVYFNALGGIVHTVIAANEDEHDTASADRLLDYLARKHGAVRYEVGDSWDHQGTMAEVIDMITEYERGKNAQREG